MIKTLFLLSTVYCEIKKKINNELWTVLEWHNTIKWEPRSKCLHVDI